MGGGGGLIEREPDLAVLDAAMGRSLHGEGSLLVVEGPAGIGKTRLLEAFREGAARADVRLLDARCRELERDFTHGVARQIFERTLLGADPGERERLLAGPAASAGAAILSDDPIRPHNAPGDSDFAAVHGLYWLAANIAAERPLALVIDDAQWADAASLRFVTYLANRLSGMQLLLVLATRSGETGADVALMQELTARADSVLSLAVLTRAGTAEVVRERTGADGAFAEACHESSGGNPFLLHELLSALAEDRVEANDAGAARVREIGPQSVSRAVFLRLARLPAGAADFARAIAVLGDEVELPDAAALARIPLERATELSDRLAVAGVLAREVPLRFMHPVILEAVTADLVPGDRMEMHARAAALLHERGASADRIALHLASTDPLDEEWAVEVLRRAAQSASARGAPEVALRHLRRALREKQSGVDRSVLLAELGEAEWLTGDEPETAIAHLEEATRLATDPAVRAQATIVTARAIFSSGDAPAAADALLRALEGADDLGPEGAVRVEAELGSVGLLNLTLMPDAHARLLALRDRVGEQSEELLLLCNFAVLAWMSGTAEETAAIARRALAGGRLLAAVGSDTIAYLQAMWVLLGADRLEEAGLEVQAGLTDARERGSAFGFTACCTLAAMTAIRAGDVRESEAYARAGIESMEPALFVRPSIYTQLALALIERGELDEAEAALEGGFVGPLLPRLAQMNHGFYARGLLRVAQGRDEEAVEDLLEFGAREAECLVANAAVPWRVPAARACLRLGRREDAERLLDEHDGAAEHWGTPAAIGIGLHGRAEASEGEERVALLERARDLLAESPNRLAEAGVLLDLGLALRRAGQRRAAQRHIVTAVALARQCGATALATRANDELGVLAAKPRSLQFSGVESLTASERRVALMAADGLTNPQIAQALFVTAKTVENHLGRVYLKLGINSRNALPAALEESEPDPVEAGPQRVG